MQPKQKTPDMIFKPEMMSSTVHSTSWDRDSGPLGLGGTQLDRAQMAADANEALESVLVKDYYDKPSRVVVDNVLDVMSAIASLKVDITKELLEIGNMPEGVREDVRMFLEECSREEYLAAFETRIRESLDIHSGTSSSNEKGFAIEDIGIVVQLFKCMNLNSVIPHYPARWDNKWNHLLTSLVTVTDLGYNVKGSPQSHEADIEILRREALLLFLDMPVEYENVRSIVKTHLAKELAQGNSLSEIKLLFSKKLFGSYLNKSFEGQLPDSVALSELPDVHLDITHKQRGILSALYDVYTEAGRSEEDRVKILHLIGEFNGSEAMNVLISHNSLILRADVNAMVSKIKNLLDAFEVQRRELVLARRLKEI